MKKLLLAICASSLVALAIPQSARSQAVPRPNIILILTDDQRWDTVRYMQTLKRRILGPGVKFANGFVSYSLCCPSRSSTLTGNYAHTTGVWGNDPPEGGYEKFTSSGNDRSTVATWLHDAGYRTGLVGKYLNHYDEGYIPPGWDRWFAFRGYPRYWGFSVNDDGTTRTFDQGQYQTTVLRQQALDFVRSTPRDEPFFLWFAPFAPHSPALPEPKYDSLFKDLRDFRPPSFNEADMSDKPVYMGRKPVLTDMQMHRTDALRIRILQSLQSVDAAVGALLDALQARRQLASTMIVFASDNGYSLGEHRHTRKNMPYEEDIRVPYAIRYDSMSHGAADREEVVANIDLAPTFAEVAGVTPPSTDGRSLVPLLQDSARSWRPNLLLERYSPSGERSFCGLRTDDGFTYALFGSGEEEMYDLALDPDQLESVGSDPSYAEKRRELRAETIALCDPPPPGMSLP
jgi:arylsulfatase A-like enzyme